MQEGLRRLRAIGAQTAFVTTIHDNEAARSLYESVDFYTINRERLYGKNARIVGLRLDFRCNRGYSTLGCSLRK
jgi:ribosomal protein S18 acetylase RimI-like enzyme